MRFPVSQYLMLFPALVRLGLRTASASPFARPPVPRLAAALPGHLLQVGHLLLARHQPWLSAPSLVSVKGSILQLQYICQQNFFDCNKNGPKYFQAAEGVRKNRTLEIASRKNKARGVTMEIKKLKRSHMPHCFLRGLCDKP
jgi:hypothetical protein